MEEPQNSFQQSSQVQLGSSRYVSSELPSAPILKWTNTQIECCPLRHHHFTPSARFDQGIICRLSPPRRPSHHSVQRHVRILCMVGICQRTEQRQDRSSNKPHEMQRVPPSDRK